MNNYTKDYKDDNLWLMFGDCLERMKEIPEDSVDAIICDLPYGTTSCSWDSVIPFDKLWLEYRRVIKTTGAIVLFGSEPFSSKLRISAIDLFKYDWIWVKSRPTGHVHAKNKPMKKHEVVSIFSKGTTTHATQSKTRMTYNPQGLTEVNRESYRPSRGARGSDVVGGLRPSHTARLTQTHEGYPKSVIEFNSEHNVGAFHPTQKPLALIEYLVNTYSSPYEVILDNTMGSGTAGVACKNLSRKFIGIEMDEKYFQVAKQRILTT